MNKPTIALSSIALLASLAYAGHFVSTLSINGKLVSSRVRNIDGEAWVPVKDLAKAQGLTPVLSGSNIDLTTAGGANQVGKLTGNVGDTLFDGHWRFTVNQFAKVISYKITTKTSTDYSVYSPIAEITDGVITPKDGYVLYVANVTIKNGNPTQEQFEWSGGDNHASIADTSGSNHPWLVFDTASPAFVTKPMLPGSALTFDICFGVAATAKPQDLIMTLLTLGQKHGTDVRVHLPG